MSSIALLACVLIGVPRPAHPALRAAVDAYDNFDTARATVAFERILRENPPSDVAATVHLYLGIIAFEAHDPDRARQEFKQALQSNPAIDAPFNCSPKVMLAMDQVRRELANELGQPRRTQLNAEPQPSNSPALTGPPLVVTEPALVTSSSPGSHSHWLALTLGGVGVACGVVAAVGGIQVLNYNGLVNSANGGMTQVTGTQIKSAQGSANFWRYGWIGFAAGGAAALVAGALTW